MAYLIGLKSKYNIVSAFKNKGLKDLFDDIDNFDYEREKGKTWEEFEEEYNDTNVAFTNPKRLVNITVVRLSKKPQKGPLLGHSDHQNLGLTYGGDPPDDENGLTFGFEEAYFNQHKTALMSKYGNYASKYSVAEALKVEHMGDYEEQVIFQASAAKKLGDKGQ